MPDEKKIEIDVEESQKWPKPNPKEWTGWRFCEGCDNHYKSLSYTCPHCGSMETRPCKEPIEQH
jgi:hypothetical protein